MSLFNITVNLTNNLTVGHRLGLVYCTSLEGLNDTLNVGDIIIISEDMKDIYVPDHLKEKIRIQYEVFTD